MQNEARGIEGAPASSSSPLIVIALFAASLVLLAAILMTNSLAAVQRNRPTIVLVHGAFAGSSSWNSVAARLIADGYPVVAVANPLRGVKADALYVNNLLASISGPVILVGHSYGGSVISNAVGGRSNVKGLVYVSAFAPEKGESAATLAARFPGSTLGPALAPPVSLADGSEDLYIDQDKFHAQFAADLPSGEAALMAATQRPVTGGALNEAAAAPAWKTIPSWFFYGTLDRNIPVAVHRFMAQRARARMTVEIDGGSHVVLLSHPGQLAKLIEEAAVEAPR